jgi:hypothetical protein
VLSDWEATMTREDHRQSRCVGCIFFILSLFVVYSFRIDIRHLSVHVHTNPPVLACIQPASHQIRPNPQRSPSHHQSQIMSKRMTSSQHAFESFILPYPHLPFEITDRRIYYHNHSQRPSPSHQTQQQASPPRLPWP